MHLPLIVPFRWDVARPHELGSLIEAEPAPAYPEFDQDLRRCCARVVTAAASVAGGAGDADLIFVGRSPESLCDYLRGVFYRTRWHDRARLLLVSLRSERPAPRAVEALRAYLATFALDPAALATRPRPAVLIDLVCTGGTLGSLVRLLHDWCRDQRGDWRACRDKLRVAAITEQTGGGGGADSGEWRYQQHRATAGLLKRSSARAVAVPARLWRYLGDEQPKVSVSHTPDRWADPRAAVPHHGPDAGPALRAARDRFIRARDRPERRAFVAELSRCGGMRYEGVRRLAGELRGSPALPAAVFVGFSADPLVKRIPDQPAGSCPDSPKTRAFPRN